MKKSMAVFGIIACMFGLCACGSNSTETDQIMTEEDAISVGTQTAEAIVSYASMGQEYIDQYADQEVIYNGFTSWQSAAEDVGTYTGVISAEATVDDEEAIVDVTLGGTSHDAVMEIILTTDDYTSISTSVKYTFGEQMGKAGLNTLIGMGTVFIVLILISLIISCFKFIPMIQGAFSKKKKDDKDIKAVAVDNTIAQIIEKEEQSDDLELVAVIAAAVAASEGAASTDGFVVRSIRKRA